MPWAGTTRPTSSTLATTAGSAATTASSPPSPSPRLPASAPPRCLTSSSTDASISAEGAKLCVLDRGEKAEIGEDLGLYSLSRVCFDFSVVRKKGAEAGESSGKT